MRSGTSGFLAGGLSLTAASWHLDHTRGCGLPRSAAMLEEPVTLVRSFPGELSSLFARTMDASTTGEAPAVPVASSATPVVDDDVALQWARRRVIPTSQQTTEVKWMGLRFLRRLISTLDGAGSAAGGSGTPPSGQSSPQVAAIARVVALLDALPSASLFPDWSPPRSPPVTAASFLPDSVTASADADNAKKALSSTAAWNSAVYASGSSWSGKVALGAGGDGGDATSPTADDTPLSLAHLEFEWDVTAEHRYLPDTFSVQTSTDGSLWNTVVSKRRARAGVQSIALEGQPGPYVRIKFFGAGPGNPTSVHSLTKVRVRCNDTKSLFVSGKETTDDLYAWLRGVVSSTTATTDSQWLTAVRGLQGIVRTSGSLVNLLTLVAELLQRSDVIIPASSQLHDTSVALVAQLREFAEAERRASASKASASRAGSGSKTGFGELPGTPP